MSHFICFDLEGPLSPQDNAYELMNLFPQGKRLFEVISRYDDLLALEGKEGYEPGDTLALIVPFLLYHGICEDNIGSIAQKAKLVQGARELVTHLISRGWEVFCISTSYEQHALTITGRVGIDRNNVACTSFPLDSYRQMLSQESSLRIRIGKIEEEILSLPAMDDGRIKACLDRFYWVDLPSTELGRIIQQVRPVGGMRKVMALQRFAAERHQHIGSFVVVGDSITDSSILESVNGAGGLSVAFNANEYALPCATLSLASIDLSDLASVLEAWARGGRGGAEQVVREKEKAGGMGNREHFHWLEGARELKAVQEVHRRIRRLVREEAASLG